MTGCVTTTAILSGIAHVISLTNGMGSKTMSEFPFGTPQDALLPYVDHNRALMFATNCAEPYDHDLYARYENMTKAALLLFTNGDQPFADAFMYFLIDSGENMEWLLRKLRAGEETRNDFCYSAHTITHDEWYAGFPVAVELTHNGVTSVDRYQTRQEAQQDIDAQAAQGSNGHVGRFVEG